MRPIPRSRHLLAVMLLAAYAAGSGFLAMRDDRLSDLQVRLAATALKRHQPALYAHDPLLGSSEVWRTESPAFQSLLEMVLVPTGYRDPSLPFRAICGIVVMIYLCGMYALLHRQCRSWSISVFVSILSATIIYSPGDAMWGVGALSSISPPALFNAMVPLIVLAYLRYADQWRIVLVFGFIGLMGNLDLSGSVNLSIVLAMAYLAKRRFTPLAWATVLGCAVAAVAGMLPYASYLLGLSRQIDPGGGAVGYAPAREALRRLEVLYPELLDELLNWLLLAGVLVISAVAVLTRVERFRMRDLGFWVLLACAGLVTALGFSGLTQLIARVRNIPPPAIDLIQALSLVMLPLYVLLGQALTNLFRLVRTHRAAVRWVCAAMLAAWVLPSDNFRVIRHAGMDTATAFMDENDRPRAVRRHQRRTLQTAELAAIGHWASDPRRCDLAAVFITDLSDFRLLGRRAILACGEDADAVVRHRSSYLPQWSRLLALQGRLLHPDNRLRTDSKDVTRFVAEIARDELAVVPEWYAIFDANSAPDAAGGLKEIHGNGWGEYYRLYRIR